MTKSLERIRKKYVEACTRYVTLFCEKQELDFDFWVADRVGGTFFCGDYFFDIQDVIFDLETNQPKEAILDWYCENINDSNTKVSYLSYSNGLRVADVKNN